MASSLSLFSLLPPETKQDFALNFDRQPFLFPHSLVTSELFSFPALRALAGRRAGQPNTFYIEAGETSAGAKWQPGTTGLGAEEAVDVFAAGHSDQKLWLMLKRVQQDPLYAAALEGWITELSALVGYPFMDRYRDPVMTVLITSPGRVTPCHCDGEANLLLQIRGSKTVSIADGADRSLLPEEALDRFWSGDTQPVQMTSELASRATRYQITPGLGVTNPVAFPHWVENGDAISVSLSLNFKRRVDHAADVHKVNWNLRKLGMHPVPPGRWKLVDETKSGLYRTALAVKRGISSHRRAS